jgi:acyl carrier protein
MEKELKQIFEEVLSVKLNNYHEIAELDIDSLDLISIFFKLENELNIIVSNEDVNEYELSNSENLVKYLQNKVMVHN